MSCDLSCGVFVICLCGHLPVKKKQGMYLAAVAYETWAPSWVKMAFDSSRSQFYHTRFRWPKANLAGCGDSANLLHNSPALMFCHYPVLSRFRMVVCLFAWLAAWLFVFVFVFYLPVCFAACLSVCLASQLSAVCLSVFLPRCLCCQCALSGVWNSRSRARVPQEKRTPAQNRMLIFVGCTGWIQ